MMRFLCSGELIACDDPALAERALALLASQGHRRQGPAGLWSRDGEACLAERREGRWYFDGRLREELVVAGFFSGG